MRVFACPDCGSPIYFENLQCGCGFEISYDPVAEAMVQRTRSCANRAEIGCNWQPEEDGALCPSCAMTNTRPDLSVEGNDVLWQRAEAAKRQVLSQLMSLGWFTSQDPGARPVFNLLAEQTAQGQIQPMMGHLNGCITINVAEANPAEIVARREEMDEPYRTMIGHFRHEIAHFLFLRLSELPSFLDRFRCLFGDERTDYAQALAQYHDADARPNWREVHITRYAASHPHEDWAETAAHALHLRDVVESAAAVDLGPDAMPKDAEHAIATALELTLALNHVNRSMGLGDLYPFVVSPDVRAKLRFAFEALSEGPVPDRTATRPGAQG